MLESNGAPTDSGWPDEVRPRLDDLRHVTAKLAAAVDMDTVVELVVAHAKDALDATVATLSVLEGADTLVVVGSRGGRAEINQRWPSYSVDAELPVCEAFRTGELVVAAGRPDFERRYPLLPDYWSPEHSVIGIPMSAGSERVGVIGLVFDRLVELEKWELQLLMLFAETCAQVIVRVRAVAAAAGQAARLAFLSEAAIELGSSLDYRVTLANVANLVTTRIADWCAIDIIEDGVLHTLAVAHADPARLELAREFRDLYPLAVGDGLGIPNVARTGISELHAVITDEMLVEAARDEVHLRMTRALELRSAMLVPLIARGRTLGVMTLARSDPQRGYDESDLAIAEDLARRASVAIDNSQLHSQTLEVALTLQHAVLPETLPSVEGWDVASVYHPAGRTDVGGDFYDVIDLPDGSVIAVLGDVMGRGVAAAAGMAQIRATIRAYVSTGADPTTVLEKLDRFFALYRVPEIVTLVYVLLQPTTGALRFSNAGHPPPLMVDADGTVHRLDPPAQLPVGAMRRPPRSAHLVELAPGSTLLLYTDGLIERRSEDIDAGITRLAEHAAALRHGELAAGLDRLVHIVQDDGRDDDIAALALRRH